MTELERLIDEHLGNWASWNKKEERYELPFEVVPLADALVEKLKEKIRKRSSDMVGSVICREIDLEYKAMKGERR